MKEKTGVNTRNSWLYGSLTVLVIVVMIYHPPVVHAQEDAIPRIASLPIQVNTRALDALWRETIALLKNDDLKGVLRKIEEVDVQKVQSGLKNLPFQSAALIQYARMLEERQRIADAVTLAEAAKRLSPDSAPVYFVLAKLRLAEDRTDLYGFVREMFFGMLAQYQDIGTIIVVANNILSILLIACMLTGIVFVLFSFIYYRQAIFYYYFKHLLPLPLPVFVTNILGWVLIGVITLSLGVFWGILFLAASLIPHADQASRWILNLCLLFGSLMAVELIALGTTFTQFDNDYFQALRELSYGTYSAKTVTVLQEQLQKDPRDAYAMFGLAYIASYSGQEREAIVTYEDISRTYPGYAAAQNNLGTLYHQQFLETENQQSYENAFNAYDSAIRASRQMFEPRYNVAQLELTDLSTSTESANNLIATAIKINKIRFNQQSRYLEYGIVTTDASLSLTVLLKKFLEPPGYEAGMILARRLWSSGSRFDNPWFFSAASLLLLILSGLMGPSKTSPKKVVYCQMCGDPFPIKVRKRRPVRRKRDEEEDGEKKKAAPETHNFCTQCTYIFKKKTTVKPEKRTQKVNQIHIRQNLRSVIAKIGSLVCPGGGQIYYGYNLKGILLAFGFYLGLSILALKILSKQLLVAEGYSGWSLLTLVVSVALLGAAYLLNLLDIMKLSPKNQ